MEKIYKCLENDVEIKFIFEEENAVENEYLYQLEIGVVGMGEWTVVGYQDLQDALYKMGYDLCKR